MNITVMFLETHICKLRISILLGRAYYVRRVYDLTRRIISVVCAKPAITGHWLHASALETPLQIARFHAGHGPSAQLAAVRDLLSVGHALDAKSAPWRTQWSQSQPLARAHWSSYCSAPSAGVTLSWFLAPRAVCGWCVRPRLSRACWPSDASDR